MRRRSIWIGFALSVVAACAALALLSVAATRAEKDRDLAFEAARRSEQAEALAKRMVDRRDRISRAVWRLDTMLTPLVAQESTRPAEAFRSFLDLAKDAPLSPSQSRSPGNSRGNSATRQGTVIQSDEALPSPLLTWVSDYVVLHFQVDDLGVWSSPQLPNQDEPWQQWVAESSLDQRRADLQRLSSTITRDDLLKRLPDQLLRVGNENLYTNNSFDYPQMVADAAVGDTSAYRQDSLKQIASQRQTTEVLTPGAEIVGEQGELPSSTTPKVDVLASLGLRDWDLRNRLFETFANEALRTQRMVLNYEQSVEETGLRGEGLTRPIWIGEKLLLARRWRSSTECELVQGCWLDWPKLRARLLADIQDLLPNADLQPVNESTALEPSQLLATLPVQLIVNDTATEVPSVASVSFRQGRVAWVLVAAWSALVLASMAAAAVIFQAESLASRRAQFVSSVTHELRTPLTTFRMYTEMLETGMVPAGNATQEYLSTLRGEAERLTHLVDNVLVYSRLEHGRRRRALRTMSVGSLLEQIEPRLRERAALARMSWTSDVQISGVDGSGGDWFECLVAVDPIAFEQVLFNLVDNACKYANQGTNPRIELSVVIESASWSCTVKDHGPGIPVERRHRLFRLFAKSDSEAAVTAPGVGLGLALSRRLAKEMGGRLEFVPGEGVGASFRLSLPR